MSGLALVGRGAAFPSDLGLGADGPRSLSGDDAWALLLGTDWRAELARRGLAPERARDVHGVRLREWLHRPGAQPTVERGTERLALRAAQRALEQAGSAGREIDLLVAATSTPDRIGASLAARLAAALGVRGASFDVRAGGAGGVLAWLAAARWLADEGRTALVVAAETPSAYLHADDPGDALLFGDGAGAVVLRREEGARGGLAAGVAFTRALAGRAFTVPGALPPSAQALAAGDYRVTPPDEDYLRGLHAAWRELREALAERLGALPAAPARLCANPATRAGALACHGLGPALEPTLDCLAQHGACGAAAPLIAVAEAPRDPQRLVLAAVGGGVHAAGLVWDP